jgi:hypothetical protein
MADKFTNLERLYIDQITALRLEYEDRIRPHVQALMKIRSLRPPAPIWVDAKKFPGVDIDAVHKAR